MQSYRMLAALALMALAFSRAPANAASICGGEASDDTACLQDMIKAGGNVVLPANRIFRITKTLQVGPNTVLNGHGSKISSDLPIGILSISGNNATIRDLKLESLNDTSARDRVAIMVAPGVSNLEIYNNDISGYFGIGIMIAGGRQRDIKIVKNTIDPGRGKIGFGILVNAVKLSEDPAVYPHDIAIVSNTVTNVSSDSVEINSPVGSGRGYPATTNNIVIQNNILSAPNSGQPFAGFCVGIAGVYRVKISGNRMSNCKWQGIHIEDNSSQIDIVENTISKTIGPVGDQTGGWRGHSSGIFALNSNNIRILGNTVRDTADHGIEMGYNPKGMNTEVTIAGNMIINAGNAGIVFAGSSNADVDSTVGAANGYRANIITNSGQVDIAACVRLRGGQGRRAYCSRR